MQQRIIEVLCQHGLNPTEPFKFYLDVGSGRFDCLAILILAPDNLRPFHSCSIKYACSSLRVLGRWLFGLVYLLCRLSASGLHLLFQRNLHYCGAPTCLTNAWKRLSVRSAAK
jgi:hypothetical protein